MNVTIIAVGGRAPLRKKPRPTSESRSPGAARALLSPAQRAARRRWSWSRVGGLVDLGLHDPVPQSLGIDPELLAHTAERSRPRRWIPSRVHGHPRGPLPKFIGVLPRCCHTPHPPVGSEPTPDPWRFSLRSAPDRKSGV